jgi:hypothetical protein
MINKIELPSEEKENCELPSEENCEEENCEEEDDSEEEDDYDEEDDYAEDEEEDEDQNLDPALDLSYDPKYDVSEPDPWGRSPEVVEEMDALENQRDWDNYLHYFFDKDKSEQIEALEFTQLSHSRNIKDLNLEIYILNKRRTREEDDN